MNSLGNMHTSADDEESDCSVGMKPYDVSDNEEDDEEDDSDEAEYVAHTSKRMQTRIRSSGNAVNNFSVRGDGNTSVQSASRFSARSAFGSNDTDYKDSLSPPKVSAHGYGRAIRGHNNNMYDHDDDIEEIILESDDNNNRYYDDVIFLLCFHLFESLLLGMVK